MRKVDGYPMTAHRESTRKFMVTYVMMSNLHGDFEVAAANWKIAQKIAFRKIIQDKIAVRTVTIAEIK